MGVDNEHIRKPSEPRSQALEAEWLSAVSQTQDALLSIDCEDQGGLCAEYKIASYPTLQLFKSGKPLHKYLGPHRASAILNFVARLKRPVVSAINAASVEDFKAVDETVFIGYVGEGDTKAKDAFERTAERFREEFSFAIVSDEAAIPGQNMHAPAVVCHIREDEGEARSLASLLSGQDELNGFVSEASRRFVGELTLYNQQRLLDRQWPMVYLFDESEEGRAKLRQSMRRLGKSYFDSLTCVTVDPMQFPGLQAEMGLEPGVFPAGAVHQLSQDRIYPYPPGQPVDQRAIQKWGLDVWQGCINPWTPPGARGAPGGPFATATVGGLGVIKTATRKLSMAHIPGVNIRVGGRDEL